MLKTLFTLSSMLILLWAAAPLGSPAEAQSVAGCKVTALTDPPREVLRCGSGLKIEAENGAQYRMLDQNKLEVTSRAVLVDVTPGRLVRFPPGRAPAPRPP